MTESVRRRQRLSPDERRGQLFLAAVQVLDRHGFAGATADAIAREAGVSKGLLWHYFADLDELLEVTARQTLVTLRDAVAAKLDLTAPAPTVIREAIAGAAALQRTHRVERRAMQEIVRNLRTADGTSRFSADDYDELYAAQESLIFRRGQEAGDFRADLDPRLLAVTYQGVVDAMLDYLDGHPEADPAQHAHTLAEILLGGMSK